MGPPPTGAMWGEQSPKAWTSVSQPLVTSLVGKEPELVRAVETYRLRIIGVTSGSGAGSLGFFPVDQRVASLRLCVGDWALTVLMSQTAGWRYWLESSPKGDSIVLLGDFHIRGQ